MPRNPSHASEPLLPLTRIAVAIKADRLAGLDILAYNIYNSRCLVLALGYQGIYTSLEVFEHLSYGSIQYDERRCTVDH